MDTATTCIDAPSPPESCTRLRSVPPPLALTPQQAITKYERLVHWIARQTASSYGLPCDDLAQEGFIALVTASNTYDAFHAKSSVPFGAYAVTEVRSHIRDVARRERRGGLVTTGAGGDHTRGLIPIALNRTHSIDASNEHDDDDAKTGHDTIGRPAEQETAFADAEERATLDKAVASLDARDREVLSLLVEGLPQHEIASRIGVCQMRISQLEGEIHERLRLLVNGRTLPNRPRRGAVEYNGVFASIAQHARARGMKNATVHLRMKLGWTLKEALETPAAKSRWTKSNAADATPARPWTGLNEDELITAIDARADYV